MPLPLIPLLAGIVAGQEKQKASDKNKRSEAAKKGAAKRRAKAGKKNAGR